jgi:hypothetical protein
LRLIWLPLLYQVVLLLVRVRWQSVVWQSAVRLVLQLLALRELVLRLRGLLPKSHRRPKLRLVPVQGNHFRRHPLAAGLRAALVGPAQAQVGLGLLQQPRALDQAEVGLGI